MASLYRRIRATLRPARLWWRHVRAELFQSEQSRLLKHHANCGIDSDGLEIQIGWGEKLNIIGRILAKQNVVFPHIIRMRTFVDSGCLFHVDNRIEQDRIERYGSEREFTRLIVDELREGDNYFDVGSCLGLVALNAAAKGANVFAFEPEPSYRAELEKNIALNHFQNVRVVEWAVSDEAGCMELHISGAIGEYSPSLRKIEKHDKTVQVETKPLDAAIKSGELPRPDVIKIDIEGAEILALKGMRELLAQGNKAPRVIFIEVHPSHLELFDSSAREVVSLITSYGYEADYDETRHGQTHYRFRKTA